jgi:hypothetical protein
VTVHRECERRRVAPELLLELARYRRERDAVPPVSRERHEDLEWRIRRAEKRMAETEAKLARAAEG